MKKLEQPPTAPDNLTEREVAMFYELAKVAMDGPGLTQADVYLLEMAAVNYGKWCLANDALNAAGLTVETETPTGETKVSTSPFATEVHKFENAFIKRMLDLRLIRTESAKKKATAEKSDAKPKPFDGVRLHKA